MGIKLVISKKRVKNIYRYKEAENDHGQKILGGWESISNIDLDQKLVLSYPSKSLKVLEEYASSALIEGVSVSSASDYISFFSALTGEAPDDFHGKWAGRVDALELEHSLSLGERYTDGQGEFFVNLSALLSGVKERFSQFGRVYKAVHPSD